MPRAPRKSDPTSSQKDALQWLSAKFSREHKAALLHVGLASAELPERLRLREASRRVQELEAQAREVAKVLSSCESLQESESPALRSATDLVLGPELSKGRGKVRRRMTVASDLLRRVAEDVSEVEARLLEAAEAQGAWPGESAFPAMKLKVFAERLIGISRHQRIRVAATAAAVLAVAVHIEEQTSSQTRKNGRSPFETRRKAWQERLRAARKRLARKGRGPPQLRRALGEVSDEAILRKLESERRWEEEIRADRTGRFGRLLSGREEGGGTNPVGIRERTFRQELVRAFGRGSIDDLLLLSEAKRRPEEFERKR